MHDIQDARRHAHLDADFRKFEGSHGRDFRGFANHAVAGRQRRRDFPGEQIKRQVPRRNAARHASGAAQRVVYGTVLHDVRFAGKMQDRAGIKPEVAGRTRDVDIFGQGNRLAIVNRFSAGKVVQVGLNELGNAHQKIAAGFDGRGGPARKRGTRRCYRVPDVTCIRVRRARVNLAGCRLVVVEVVPGIGWEQLAVYVVGDAIHRIRPQSAENLVSRAATPKGIPHK